jgi:hypothetical protein
MSGMEDSESYTPPASPDGGDDPFGLGQVDPNLWNRDEARVSPDVFAGLWNRGEAHAVSPWHMHHQDWMAAPPDWRWGAVPPGWMAPPDWRAKPTRDWKKRFVSNFNPVPAAFGRCDKVSDAFKQSTMDYVIVIFSHGGIVDDGTQMPLMQPMFRTGQPVVFPVRYGSPIMMSPNPMDVIASNLPVTTMDVPQLTGAQLLIGLENGLNLTNMCIRQYDVGSSVPNLEIFTSGVVLDPLGGENIFLYDCVTRTYHSLIESSKTLKKNLRSVRKKITSIIAKKTVKMVNENPLYRTSTAYKKKTKQPTNHPLTLADFCDAEHGLFKKMNFNGHELSEIPVVVLACRAGIAWDSGSRTSSSSDMTHSSDRTSGSSDRTSGSSDRTSGSSDRTSVSSHPVISPVSSDYMTASSAHSSSSHALDLPSDLDEGLDDDARHDGASARYDGGKNRKKTNKKRRNHRNATKKRRRLMKKCLFMH